MNFRKDWLGQGEIDYVEYNEAGLPVKIILDCGIVITGQLQVYDPEYKKGLEALESIPEIVRKYYKIHYNLTKKPYKFAGLVCKSCNRWSDGGHDLECPVNDIMVMNEG